jgi:hypothetical protein
LKEAGTGTTGLVPSMLLLPVAGLIVRSREEEKLARSLRIGDVGAAVSSWLYRALGEAGDGGVD